MLRFVLDACPSTRLADVADTAHQWCEEGQSKRAVALLEPFFAAPKALTIKLELLFDELMSTLMEEGRHKRREHWIVEVLARGDNALKSTALQRRATLRSDQGRVDAGPQSGTGPFSTRQSGAGAGGFASGQTGPSQGAGDAAQAPSQTREA